MPHQRTRRGVKQRRIREGILHGKGQERALYKEWANKKETIFHDINKRYFKKLMFYNKGK